MCFYSLRACISNDLLQQILQIEKEKATLNCNSYEIIHKVWHLQKYLKHLKLTPMCNNFESRGLFGNTHPPTLWVPPLPPDLPNRRDRRHRTPHGTALPLRSSRLNLPSWFTSKAENASFAHRRPVDCRTAESDSHGPGWWWLPGRPSGDRDPSWPSQTGRVWVERRRSAPGRGREGSDGRPASRDGGRGIVGETYHPLSKRCG